LVLQAELLIVFIQHLRRHGRIHKFEDLNVGDLGPFQQNLRQNHSEPE